MTEGNHNMLAVNILPLTCQQLFHNDHVITWQYIYLSLANCWKLKQNRITCLLCPHDFCFEVMLIQQAINFGFCLQERIINRMKIFSQMDLGGTGKITFDGWLRFAMEHIIGKVRRF